MGVSEQEKENFITELAEKGARWEFERQNPDVYWETRGGDCMKDALDVCRKHGIELHPTVLVAVISAITLEGWQHELDPTVSIMDHIGTIMEQKQALEDAVQDMFIL